jgi:catechol 2,3-dioxygenase-like lactoylglutathione lyase family enzyme
MEFEFEHVHIKCHDVNLVKQFYETMFGAKPVDEGKVRNARVIIMKLGDAYITLSEPGEREVLEVPKEPREDVWIRYGIGHFGVRVKNLEDAVRELKAKGAEWIWEPREIREGVKVAFIRGPEDDVIEIVERRKGF